MAQGGPSQPGNWQAMDVFQPQFEGGGPPVLVRNTFLDIDDRPPTPPALQRAKTAPPPRSNSLIVEGEERQAGPDSSSSSSEESVEEKPRRAKSGGVEALRSPNSPLDRPVTRDCYERREDWRWVPSASSAQGVTAKASTPSGSPGASPLPPGEGQPPVMYPQPMVRRPEVSMMPVMLPVDAGLPAGDAPGQQQQHAPGRGAGWPEPAPMAPVPTLAAAGGGAGSIEVSASAVPAAVPASIAPGTDDLAPLAAPQPQTLTRAFSINSGYFRVHWTVDARKLRGNDKQAVSPPFELSFGNQFPSVTFKMMIYPKVMNDSKGGASFKKARGRGFVQLKCEAELSEAIANVSFRISIGSGESKQAPRGPKSHNFSCSAVCGLDKEEEEWDFQSVVDQESMTFVVCLEIVPCPCK
uniref:Uncharacterized protein n=1 Tax=Alexandrium monilatum TaxID=311494 RepID=A0A7S4SJR8_9DINO